MVGCVCAKECEHTRLNSYLALLKVREAIADDFITQRVVKSSAYIFPLLYICINELYTMYTRIATVRACSDCLSKAYNLWQKQGASAPIAITRARVHKDRLQWNI